MTDRKMFAVFSLVVGMLLAGCTVKRPIGTHYFVGPSCHPTADLIECDGAEPPNCQRETVHFDKGCEQLVVDRRN